MGALYATHKAGLFLHLIPRLIPRLIPCLIPCLIRTQPRFLVLSHTHILILVLLAQGALLLLFPLLAVCSTPQVAPCCFSYCRCCCCCSYYYCCYYYYNHYYYYYYYYY